ncbi:MAG: glycoside hydrolase family 38 C-terminal domain-containing protein [Victivallaceae bacterium]|nr:glycoside hydrolase family 38 C-terminal domain-containing protein [Victivallaceae bacterium]
MKFYYFTATHWDREWYQSFQAYRKYLVDTVEVLLELFENDPEYKKFSFDGQTIVLEDILAVRPDLRSRIQAQIDAGKLNIGPWYVMPDEFLCSSEAMIRNLLIGKNIAEKEFHCKAWPVGYVCDIFGHIARLPQLFQGFGAVGIVLWRGTAETMPPFSIWESPDGSKLPVVRLFPGCGYADFGLTVRGWVADLPMEKKEFLEHFRACVDLEKGFWGKDCFVLSDGFDHCAPCRQTSEFLRWIQEERPQDELVWSDYRDLFREVFQKPQPTVKGEMIAPLTASGKAAFQISGTLSSRYDIKEANDFCQDLLEKLIEPQMTARFVSGDRKDLPFLHFAWKHLVQNHAHDSICGCSIDSVHELMLGRFKEVRDLADTLTTDFLNADRSRCLGKSFFSQVKTLNLIERAKDEAAPDGRYTVRIYNAEPRTVTRVCDLELRFPAAADYPKTQGEPFGYEHYNSFLLRDAQGRELKYAIASIQRNASRIFFRQDCRKYNLYKVTVEVTLTPSGWTTLSVEPSETPVRYCDSMLTGRRSASNGKIALEIASDGTYTIVDLKQNRAYPGQNEYCFEREIGDGWNHVAPLGATHCVGGNSAQVTMTENAPGRVSFEIVRSYRLPKRVNYAGSILQEYAGIRESAESEELTIRSIVSLNAGAEMVEVHTTIDNTIEDIRVQLNIPTGICGGGFASQAFGFVPRPDGRDAAEEASARYIEQERIEKNFDAVIGKRDERGGLALLSGGGLHEAGCMGQDAPGEIELTLFRAFRRTVMTDGEQEGELQKSLHFHYALAPFGAETTGNHLYRAAMLLRQQTASYMLRSDLVKSADPQTFLTVETDAVVSAIKPAEAGDGIIVRLMNLDECVVPVKLSGCFTRAVRCRLDETAEAKELAMTASGELIFALGSSQTATVKLMM